MNPYLALAISIAIGVAGQLGLKAGALHTPAIKWLIVHHYVLIGLGLYLVSALFYVYSLRTLPLSVAFPSVSASYVVVAFLAYLIWGEPFTVRHLLALLLIGTGIYLLSTATTK